MCNMAGVEMEDTLGTTEREIFSRIAFIDYGYFYDSDKNWYYIMPGSFRIKTPLLLIKNHLNNDNYEFPYLKVIQRNLITYIFRIICQKTPNYRGF